jgi:3-oxoacyl-[acyl-carrier-protein] synthase-3
MKKMDEANHTTFLQIMNRPVPQDIMPMSIHELGNSSVATVPTLFDLLIRGEIKTKEINKGDILLFLR